MIVLPTPTRFNFTYALTGGAWLEFSDGSRNWYSFVILIENFGKKWVEAQLARQGWMTGCWVDCIQP